MNWKHYLAVAAPYLIAAGIGVAGEMQHSQNTLVVSIGLLIVSALNHGNVIAHAQRGEK